MSAEVILLFVILVAGIYVAWNIGANDAANAVGTAVGSKALSLRQAVIIAACFEFLGAFFFGTHVTETVQGRIVDFSLFSADKTIIVYGMLASLLAVGMWLQLASYFRCPVSTTHSIIGAMLGFGIIAKGIEVIFWKNVFIIFFSWVLSPIFSGIISYLIFNLLRRRILYTFYPIEEAKLLAPFLAFFLMMVLSLVILFKGMTHILGRGMSFFQVVLFCVGLAFFVSFVLYLIVRRIKVVSHKKKSQATTGTDIAIGLQKASKHLKKVKSSARGSLRYHVSLLFHEVEGLLSRVQQNIKEEVSFSEYGVVEKIFSYLQVISVSLMAFSHGANDVSNAIAPLAISVKVLRESMDGSSLPIPPWILLLGGCGIILGLVTWGWRVIDTIGKKITELTPTRGFSAEFGAALTILVATRLGIPISSTHTIVGAVVGVGMARGIEALNMLVVKDVAISWFVTVPMGAGLSVAMFGVLKLFFGF